MDPYKEALLDGLAQIIFIIGLIGIIYFMMRLLERYFRYERRRNREKEAVERAKIEKNLEKKLLEICRREKEERRRAVIRAILSDPLDHRDSRRNRDHLKDLEEDAHLELKEKVKEHPESSRGLWIVDETVVNKLGSSWGFSANDTICKSTRDRIIRCYPELEKNLKD